MDNGELKMAGVGGGAVCSCHCPFSIPRRGVDGGVAGNSPLRGVAEDFSP
jgi:hypothetical protein